MPDYLLPDLPLLPNDRELEDIFGDAIAGITGLDRNDVRPSVQPAPPNMPDQEYNWCAFRVGIVNQDTFAYQRHLPSLVTNGVSQVERSEDIDVLCTFYGANSSQYMSRLREGLSLEQNRWALGEHRIKLTGLGQPQSVPSLLKNRYSRRIDLPLQFSRRVVAVYGVRTIATVDGEIHTDQGLPPIPFNVNQ